jgi:hypothetical protein
MARERYSDLFRGAGCRAALVIDAEADGPIAGRKKCEAAMGHDVVPEPGRTAVDPPEGVARPGYRSRAGRFTAEAVQRYQRYAGRELPDSAVP